MRDSPLIAHFFCFFYLLLLPQTQAALLRQGHGCREDQKSALLQLQQESFLYFSFWKPETDCCSWEGVKCNETTGYVIGLELTSLKLSRSIYSNSSLFGLYHLQRLNFAHTDFGKTPLPSGFDRLPSLTHVNLSNTCFSGQIPREFSSLTRLVALDLSTYYESCTSSLIINDQMELKPPTLESPNLQELIQNLTSLIELYLDGVDLSSQGSYWSQVLPQALPNLRALSLSRCHLLGPIHSSLSQLFFLLEELQLDENYLHVEAPKFLANFSHLKILSLRSCGLYGEFPSSVFQFPNLQILDVSDNSLLTGQLPDFPHNNALTFMSLSKTNFLGGIPDSIGNLRFLTTLGLSQCEMTGSIPSSLANLTNLSFLDLSFNSFTGSIPLFESISQLSRLEYLYLGSNNFSGTVKLDMFGNLKNLDLSNNLLSLEASNSSSTLPQLEVLRLSSCHIKEFPNFLRTQDKLQHLDLSHNQIQGHVPSWIWKGTLDFVLLSNNSLSGSIPKSICNLNSLKIFVASHNNLNGSIPECLGNIGNLLVLDVRGNRFRGMPQQFTSACSLRTLQIDGNILEGQVPRSLANCNSLEVLDLGKNKISDTFPFWLGKLPKLQVLVLHSNRFYGPIEYPQIFDEFPMLQIIDLSFNRFTGNLSPKYFGSLRAMMSENINKSERKYYPEDPYYEDSLTIMVKGHEIELGRIFTFFTTLDLSNNRFEGEIPEVIGALTSLALLNLSRNDLTGKIPPLIGNISSLEALDLSGNRLSGQIPQQLTSLTFLSVLNFSQNSLEGPIPQGYQFDTFSNNSYDENPGLCGSPLARKCGYISEQMVCGMTIRIIVGPQI